MPGAVQRLIPLSDPDGWDEALTGIGHAFAHRHDNCAAFSLSQAEPAFLYSAVAPGGRVAVPLALRSKAGHKDLVSPYGFSGFAGSGRIDGFEALFTAFARAQGWVCGFIAQHPMVPLSYFGEVADCDWDRLTREAYVIDLSVSEEEMVRRLSQNRRRQMRGWSRCDLTFDRDEILAFILANRKAFYAARSAAAVYDFADATWRALAASPNTLLIGRRLEGRIVAGSVFAWQDEIGDYLFNISVPEGQPASAQLIWEAAVRMKAAGVTSLNLGGGVSEGDGVARFKQRFGPLRLPLLALRQVYRQEVFGSLCRSAKVPAEIGQGFFPPYYKPAQEKA
ncbi:MAG: GNAT family N-acetyltransferase [Kiloniellales bacterium]